MLPLSLNHVACARTVTVNERIERASQIPSISFESLGLEDLELIFKVPYLKRKN